MFDQCEGHDVPDPDNPDPPAPASERVEKLLGEHPHELKPASGLKPDGVKGQHTCEHCGSNRCIEIALESVHGRARVKCLACRKNGPIVEAPWTRNRIERAKRCFLTFGKHKGATLGSLEKKAAGRDYIRWLGSLRNPRSEAAEAASKAARALVRRSPSTP